MLIAIPHRRKQGADVGIFLEGLADAADGVRPGIDDLRRGEFFRRHYPGAVGHLAVGEGGTVFDHQHPAIADQVEVIDEDRRGGIDHQRLRIDFLDRFPHLIDAIGFGGVDLIDQHHVGHAQVGFTGIIKQLVSRAVGIDHRDVQVGLVEGQVVITTVPHNHIGFLLRLAHDRLIIHPGVDHVAAHDMWFIFLPLLDGAFVAVEIGQFGEALHPLGHQVAVGHRMADGGDLFARSLEQLHHPAGHLALAASGAHRTDCDHRFARFNHGALRAHQLKVGSGGIDPRCQRHHIVVGHVGVSEHRLLHTQITDQVFQFAFRIDLDPFRIEVAGQFGGIFSSVNIGNLGSGKSHHIIGLIIAVKRVEIMKIPTRRAKDEGVDS